ncbi:hypothetical protein FTX61_04640 [Nitriliruptoraceae bacterium ZYF776]|nr:hypothetical protein [Profundirhabdus halotolerans]
MPEVAQLEDLRLDDEVADLHGHDHGHGDHDHGDHDHGDLVDGHRLADADAHGPDHDHEDTVVVDDCGLGFFVDPPNPRAQPQSEEAVAAARGVGAARAATTPYPTELTFTLESRPGARRTIYLDFDGHTLVDTAWNTSFELGGSYHLAPYSLDADHDTFSEADHAAIQSIWLRVAEDYAPFDVNVTTRDLGVDAIRRSNAADDTYGTRVVITNDTGPDSFAAECACGGIAYVGVFEVSGTRTGGGFWHDRFQPALVFTGGTPAAGPTVPGSGVDPKGVADTVSHEAGHNLGLRHHFRHQDAFVVGGVLDGYHPGQGLWAPIMGGSYVRPLQQWSDGDYGDYAGQSQDDVAVLSDPARLPLLDDDHGTTPETATVLGGVSPLEAEGLVGTRTDEDWFRFGAAGPTTVTVTGAGPSPNLDARVRVYAEDGVTLLGTADPPSALVGPDEASGLDAQLHLDLPAGTYYARVDGVGAGDPLVTGYSDYGSLGAYTLTVVSTEVVVVTATVTSGPPVLTSATSATFAFTASPAGSSFRCRLDQAAWQSCTSPFTVTGLADGPHTFRVQASASGGGGDSEVVTRTWTVDTVAPAVTITSGPSASTTATSATFAFAADETGVAFSCRLDDAAWAPCTSPRTVADLAVGAHTFRVRATDGAGNVSAVASRTWQVTAPTPPPTSPPPTSPPPTSPPPTSPPPTSPTSAPQFRDVPSDSPHARAIGQLAAREVTLGCGGGRFCPDAPVTRAQMATFLVKALDLRLGSTAPSFRDVPAGSTHARTIDAVRREGITLGCGGDRFCPNDDVKRDQMASFLQRALGLTPGSASPPFRDVSAGSTHARPIDAMRREGITQGCGGGRYCPGDSVTRAQMASFLVRALGW